MISSKREFLDEIRALIRSGEPVSAIDQLVSFLNGVDRDLFNESILLSSRLLDIQRRERRGVISDSEAEVKRNRIGLASLQLLDEVERQLSRKELPFATTPVEFDAPDNNTLEKIIGVSNLQSIAWLQRGLEAAKSVCRVVTPNGLGTGFLVEGGKVFTNHHVIPDVRTAAESRLEFNYEEDSSNVIQPIYSYELNSKSLVANEELDFALVEIESNSEALPISDWGYLKPDIAAIPGKGEHVTIIQHPNGGLKQIAVTANQIVNVFEHRLQYTTDTLPGSSGSPVFNDHWHVIALHHAGGNLITNNRGNRMFANEGILIRDIIREVGIAT
jgi:V8-like Glu-specific endopeptidase